MKKGKKIIIEKQLGIAGDYQYKALHGKNYLQANWHNNKLECLKELLDSFRPETVLDLGTGSGNFELSFARKIKKIVGVDYNDEALLFLDGELKKRKIKNVKLVKSDIIDLPSVKKLGTFDMIIAVDVLEHIEINSGKGLINKLKKYLNPKGKVIIVTPNYGGFWPVIERLIDKYTNIPHLENMQHITRFSAKNLSKVFQEQGFKLNIMTTFNTFSFVLPGKSASSFALKLENKLFFPFGNLLLAVFEL